MRLFARLSLLFTLLLLPVGASWASPHEGGRLRLEAAALFLAGSDRLDPGVEPAWVDAYDEDEEVDRRLVVTPVFEAAYRANAVEVYARTPYRSPSLPVAVGAVAGLPGGGAAEFSVESALMARVWSDPYLLGASREDTRLWNVTARAAWRNALGTPASLRAFFGVEHPEDDALGRREPLLERKGRTGGLLLSAAFAPAAGATLTVGAGYERGDFHGEAASYNGWRGELAWGLRDGRFGFDATLDAVYRGYGAADPVMGKKRAESETTLTGFWTWDAPGGREPLFLDLLAAFRLRDANIDFLDAKTFVLGVGAGLRF